MSLLYVCSYRIGMCKQEKSHTLLYGTQCVESTDAYFMFAFCWKFVADWEINLRSYVAFTKTTESGEKHLSAVDVMME